jgi:lysophospholipase L1-like esterase
MKELQTFDKGRPETTRGIRAHDASNTMQLSAKQWLGLAAFALAMLIVVPALWPRLEKLSFEPDYRIPFELSNDYWLYDRLTRAAAAKCDTLVVGDSVVWGQYVTREQTLTHYLNERVGRERFANLGLDGVHPAALAGLLDNYSSGIRGKTVLLECNLLWLSSPQHDLQETKEFEFNHPELVPQFFPKIPCYKADVSARLGNVVDRSSGFSAWTHHLQQAYFNRSTIPEWTLEHPYDNPLRAITLTLPASEKKLRHKPVAWTDQGITPQDFPWLALDASLQWQSFRRAIEILRQRNNRVIVLLCPFNEHMLTAESRARFARLKSEIETSFRENQIAFIAPDLLPSESYADASHPLAAGYKQLADELFASVKFQ